MTNEKMTKNQMVEEIKKLTGELYDLELTEQQMDEIDNLQEPKKSNIKALEKMLDEALATIEKDGKKAVFKWATLDGFYKIKLATVTPEKIKVGYKMSFRLDAKKIEKIDNYFYYGNDPKNKIDFSSVDFENAQDIATVKKIDKNGVITLVSDARPHCKWFVYPEDINGTKSNKCVIKDGTNIAFLVYAPIEK